MQIGRNVRDVIEFLRVALEGPLTFPNDERVTKDPLAKLSEKNVEEEGKYAGILPLFFFFFLSIVLPASPPSSLPSPFEALMSLRSFGRRYRYRCTLTSFHFPAHLQGNLCIAAYFMKH